MTTQLMSPTDLATFEVQGLRLKSLIESAVERAMLERRHEAVREVRSNYRLIDEPLRLKLRIIPVLDGVDEQSWENEGGALAPPPCEMTLEEAFGQRMRVRDSRKQRAARAVRPINAITLVPQQKPAPMQVVAARLSGASEVQVEIAKLEAQVAQLMGVVEARRRRDLEAKQKIEDAEKVRRGSVAAFEALFNARRLK
jgi:hypothetical protein